MIAVGKLLKSKEPSIARFFHDLNIDKVGNVSDKNIRPAGFRTLTNLIRAKILHSLKDSAALFESFALYRFK
jgi:hypothetical protein